MVTKAETVLVGSTGFFWPVIEGVVPAIDTEEPQRGHVNLDSETIEVQTLDEDPFSSGQRQVPVAFVAATEKSGLLILDVARAGFKRNIGGGRASLLTYTAYTALTDSDIHNIDDSRLTRASARFTGDAALRWTGLKALSQKVRTDKQQRVKEVEIRLHSVPDQKVSLPRQREMSLSAYWNVDGDARRGRTVEAGFEIGVEVGKPSETEPLVAPLLHVQSLLSLAFTGFYPVAEGVGQRAGTSTTGSFWNSALMTSGPKHQADLNTFPLFSLKDVGGIRGLARWVKLCERHPRATTPLANSVRFESWSPEVQTLEIAAAIEYWGAAHRRNRAWPRAGANHAEALALHVGSSFSSLVGDSEKWAATFWSTYNGLKHEPSFTYKPREVSVLSETALYLLLAALLNRVAGTKQPSRRVLGDHRLQRLGRRLQQFL